MMENIAIEEKDKLTKAYVLAGEYYRKEKKPELTPALKELEEILCTELNLSYETALAIFLKDLIPSELSEEQVIKEFGKPVIKLITGLQKIDRMDTGKYTSNTENFIKLLLTISDDIQVILISLGQRLQDMRHILELPVEKQIRIAGETSLLYVPLAHRIGLYRIKTEL
ncbi:MAG: HD domain-containing protein, partial [Bacteroidales bacterium]